MKKIFNIKKNKGKLIDLAGAWKMSNEEAKEFIEDLRSGWKNWKIEPMFLNQKPKSLNY